MEGDMRTVLGLALIAGLVRRVSPFRDHRGADTSDQH
jgi:hypothetical protein